MNDYIDPGDALVSELNGMKVDESQERALLELAYTASERGLIPFDIRDDCAKRLIQLVELSNRYKDGVPDNLRM